MFRQQAASYKHSKTRRLNASVAHGEHEVNVHAVMNPLTRLFFDTALLASGSGLDDAAAPIRLVLHSLGVNSVRFNTLRALVLLKRGDAAAARNVARYEVLAVRPGDELALAVVACTSHALQEIEWRGLRDAVLAISADPMARKLAASLRG